MQRLSGRALIDDPKPARIVMGIDPGTVVTGWGVVEASGSSLRYVAHGIIVTSGAPGHGERLSRIYRGIAEAIAEFEPERISLEKVFFARNAQSALKLGQARGVALLAAAHRGLVVHEYAACEIKSAVVGYGRATKEQVQRMVASLLNVSCGIAADAADALAAAICHLHQEPLRSRIRQAVPEWPSAARRKLF
jgi:crossover junction endodeoxyribonuclease RuvC